ncbi:MAG: hypothetical protein ACREYE_31215, partial [Gammaproteobacteria bacterium]
GHHQEDRAGAGQDGADQAQIHPAPREEEGGLTVKLFKGHYTSSPIAKPRSAQQLSDWSMSYTTLKATA